MPIILLPVTRRSLPFASSLLHFASRLSSPSSSRLQFLICAKSRDLERPLRAQFPSLLAAHEHEAIPDWSNAKDVQEALGGCEGAILAASGRGGEVIELPSDPTDEWLRCEQSVASLVTRDHRVVKLSWTEGFVGQRSPSAVGRANYDLEEELKGRMGDGQGAHNLCILRATTGMDAFLHGRLFDLVCGRTLSMSVKRGRIAFVHPLDVAESVVALMENKVDESKENEVLTLAGPEALTFQDVAKLLSKGIGDKVTYSHFPLWAVQPARWVHGVPGDAIEEELAVVRALEAGAQQGLSTDLMKTLLGYNPRTFYEFVRENAEAWPRTDPL
ncbi:unnamed protein product [Phytophthora lilii]|uniref:Unnamed protein product n=1 Tax=Phytophthora lilii TaxID=2077276 RepID=A0A9W6WV45_9STRA|nr:unnamed protein product [Phytophthora lilii]